MRLVLSDLYYIRIFTDAIKSELLTLIFQDIVRTLPSDIDRMWAHAKLLLLYYKANALTNWEWYPLPPLSTYHTYPTLLQSPLILYPFAKMYKKWGMFY